MNDEQLRGETFEVIDDERIPGMLIDSRYLRIHMTPKTFEFGFGFSLPAVSKFYFLGTKTRSYFEFYLFLGPFSIEIGKEADIIERI